MVFNNSLDFRGAEASFTIRKQKPYVRREEGKLESNKELRKNTKEGIRHKKNRISKTKGRIMDA